jgi:hypothetical protein
MNRSATDYPRAIADFTQAVEINPNEPVWKHHAPCFNTSGRPQFPEVVAGRGGPSAQCRNATVRRRAARRLGWMFADHLFTVSVRGIDPLLRRNLVRRN